MCVLFSRLPTPHRTRVEDHVDLARSTRTGLHLQGAVPAGVGHRRFNCSIYSSFVANRHNGGPRSEEEAERIPLEKAAGAQRRAKEAHGASEHP